MNTIRSECWRAKANPDSRMRPSRGVAHTMSHEKHLADPVRRN